MKSLPQGKHILLSACQDSEEAREFYAQGEDWGVFSYFLQTTLIGQQQSMNYQELLARVKRRVEATLLTQSPQLEPIKGANPKEVFLGGDILTHQNYIVDRDENQWWLNAGAVHGIMTPQGEHTTFLAVFPFSTDPEALKDLTKKIPNVKIKVDKVLPDKSLLKVEGELDTMAPDRGGMPNIEQ